MKEESLSPLEKLSQMSAARLGLQRAGSSVSTREILKFDLDHARARDAVHLPFDTASIINQLNERNIKTLDVSSAAKDKATYLQRPDLGRTLSEKSSALLKDYVSKSELCDISIVVTDGLSSCAIHSNAIHLLDEFLPLIPQNNWTFSPVVIASHGRVALADEIGEILKSRLSIILIGERPGLTTADSLGVYLTYEPRQGRTDADKNCISNIRKGGLSPKEAAFKLESLIQSSFKLCLSGVGLKDTDTVTIEKRIGISS
jgi:ethanolamine ammonia-lyase small subunit